MTNCQRIDVTVSDSVKRDFNEMATLRILEYVDFRRQQFIRVTSSALNRAVLKGLSFMILYQTTDNLSHLFQYCVSLQHLQLTSICKRKCVLRIAEVIQDGQLAELISLDLQYSRITDRNVRTLFEALQSGLCPKLRIIRLNNNAMSVAGSTALASCISFGSFGEIQHIDLQHNLIFAEGIRRIGRSFMDFHCRNLQSLDISRCHLANPGIKFFCEALNSCPLINLRYLRIYWNSINFHGIKHLALTISLGILDSLELLDISHNPIGEKGMNMLAESIIRGNHLSRLRVLIIHSCKLKTNGMKSVGIVIKQLKELRVLSLGNNNIRAKGVLHLFEGFRYEYFYYDNLRVLDLTNNNLGEEGMQYLTSMIRNNNCPQLQELSLISNHIKDDGLMKLIYVMKFGFLRHLKTLYLSDNNIHDRSVLHLSATLAEKKIAPSAELYIGCNHLSNTAVQSLVSLLYSESDSSPLKYVILEKKKKDIPDRLLRKALLPPYEMQSHKTVEYHVC